MARIPISETQILFGYYHSYLNVNRTYNFAIPSIRQEGGLINYPHPGADIVVAGSWLIQFKRPHFLNAENIKEFKEYIKPNDFNPPYFRFNIKNDNPTRQFERLIEATRNGFEATYISPLYRTETEFQNLLQDDILHLERYAHIDIAQFDGIQQQIGRNNNHTILYTEDSINNNYCYCFSEPKLIKANKSLPDIGESIYSKYSDYLNHAIDIIQKIFFEGNRIVISKSGYKYTRLLQERLLLEYNIFWLLKWRKNK